MIIQKVIHENQGVINQAANLVSGTKYP